MASHESDKVEVAPNHAMEDADWVHEGSGWKCTNAYVAKWLFHQHLDNKHELHMEVGKSGHPFIHVGGPRQQNHHAMNIRILSNPHAKQKRNEKKAPDRVKKKAGFEWDELQAQAHKWNRLNGLYWYV